MSNSEARLGNKKPAMKLSMDRAPVGKTIDNTSAHKADANRVIIGGQGVYGMPLMSAAAPKVKE